MAETEIVHEDPTLRIGVARNLVVFAWSGVPEGKHIRSLTRALQMVAGKRGDRFAALDLVVSGTPRFTDDIREELVKLVRDPRLQGQGSAHVVAVNGLSGTAVRAFLSTVMLVARPASPNKVFGDLASGAAWLAPLLTKGGDPWTAADVQAVATTFTGGTPAAAVAAPPRRR